MLSKLFSFFKDKTNQYFPSLRKNTSVRRFRNSLRFRAMLENKLKMRQLDNASFFDLQKLSRDIPLYTTEYFNQNCFFGNHLAAKKALGVSLSSPVRGYVEHGIYFGQDILLTDHEVNGFERYITFSDYRKECLMRAGVRPEKIQVIGPYIIHATPSLMPNQVKKLQEEFGKVLLVIPSHSHELMHTDFHEDSFINEVLKIKESIGFTNIFVCMFFVDIQKNRHVEYQKQGFTIVTAGHRHDSRFLGRLRSIIDISSSTMSNSLGTHVGYCVALGKPHYIWQQSIEYMRPSGEKQQRFSTHEIEKQYLKEEAEVIKVFSNYSETITPEQLEVVHKYWGPF